MLARRGASLATFRRLTRVSLLYLGNMPMSESVLEVNDILRTDVVDYRVYHTQSKRIGLKTQASPLSHGHMRCWALRDPPLKFARFSIIAGKPSCLVQCFTSPSRTSFVAPVQPRAEAARVLVDHGGSRTSQTRQNRVDVALFDRRSRVVVEV